jgi:hypothetical protein
MMEEQMKNALYYWYAALAYIRGWLGWRNLTHYTTCTTGLNGPSEARSMFVSHGWKPYIYRRSGSIWSRTFITGEPEPDVWTDYANENDQRAV